MKARVRSQNLEEKKALRIKLGWQNMTLSCTIHKSQKEETTHVSTDG